MERIARCHRLRYPIHDKAVDVVVAFAVSVNFRLSPALTAVVPRGLMLPFEPAVEVIANVLIAKVVRIVWFAATVKNV